MGFIESLYDMMDGEFIPAMEAEDITGAAQSASSDITGEKDPNEIDLNTDDILGTKENNPNAQNDQEMNDANTDDMNMDDMGSEESSEDTGDGGGDDLADPEENKDADDVMKEQEDPFSENQKYKLWREFKSLYETLADSIDLIGQYVPNVSDAATIKTMDNIKENLINAKDLIYQTLTIEYKSMSYPDMQKRYVGIQHIYDLCTKELEIYFDKYHKKDE